jgi:hypothetical protein
VQHVGCNETSLRIDNAVQSSLGAIGKAQSASSKRNERGWGLGPKANKSAPTNSGVCITVPIWNFELLFLLRTVPVACHPHCPVPLRSGRLKESGRARGGVLAAERCRPGPIACCRLTASPVSFLSLPVPNSQLPKTWLPLSCFSDSTAALFVPLAPISSRFGLVGAASPRQGGSEGSSHLSRRTHP